MSFAVADVHDAIACSRPDRPCLVLHDRRISWQEMAERSNRLGCALAAHGLGAHRERRLLRPWESGQDHLAIYLHNGAEYLEAMLGAFKARVAPFNVNYRYVAEELRYLLADARASAIVYHASFAPTLAAVLPELPDLRLLIEVADGSERTLLPGAVDYEQLLAEHSPSRPALRVSPDDLYILYTGGTTGAPKGVLWRQGDALASCFGGLRGARSVDEMVAAATSERRALLTAPFMHGAGHWVGFSTWHAGGVIYLPASPDRLDPADVWRTVERERIDFLLIVGDAFARPLIDELDRHDYDVSSLTVVLSGGAPLSDSLKSELCSRLPGVMILDGLGSSESGGLLTRISTGESATGGEFPPASGVVVLDETLERLVVPGDDQLGWLAKTGDLALGYLGDPDKTARTYPVIDGIRYVVPGDRARLLADGTIEVHGRDAATINSGGEKIFAEDVERALRSHPAVYDVVVAGRPSARWGRKSSPSSSCARGRRSAKRS